jgi:hypothetical protein
MTGPFRASLRSIQLGGASCPAARMIIRRPGDDRPRKSAAGHREPEASGGNRVRLDTRDWPVELEKRRIELCYL